MTTHLPGKSFLISPSGGVFDGEAAPIKTLYYRRTDLPKFVLFMDLFGLEQLIRFYIENNAYEMR